MTSKYKVYLAYKSYMYHWAIYTLLLLGAYPVPEQCWGTLALAQPIPPALPMLCQESYCYATSGYIGSIWVNHRRVDLVQEHWSSLYACLKVLHAVITMVCKNSQTVTGTLLRLWNKNAIPFSLFSRDKNFIIVIKFDEYGQTGGHIRALLYL